jgi:hypothetical protein
MPPAIIRLWGTDKNIGILTFQQTYIRMLTYLGMFNVISVDLGGLVVSVLATGPKVRGFDPD